MSVTLTGTSQPLQQTVPIIKVTHLRTRGAGTMQTRSRRCTNSSKQSTSLKNWSRYLVLLRDCRPVEIPFRNRPHQCSLGTAACYLLVADVRFPDDAIAFCRQSKPPCPTLCFTLSPHANWRFSNTPGIGWTSISRVSSRKPCSATTGR